MEDADTGLPPRRSLEARMTHTRSLSRINTAIKRFATVQAIPEVIESKAPVVSVEKVRPLTSPADNLAVDLARKFRLSLLETKSIAKAIKEATTNEAGGLDLAEFAKVMCKVFSVENVDQEVLKSAYEKTGVEAKLDADAFMAWYVSNMFTQVNALHASSAEHKGNSLTYSLSEKHDVSVSMIDTIKRQFDKYDLDKSGEIDFDEFTEMMCLLLKATKDALSEARLRKFWREIDKNAAGDIGFCGFVAWYLKYFCKDGEIEDTGPIEAMYASFNPSVQRTDFCHKNSLTFN